MPSKTKPSTPDKNVKAAKDTPAKKCGSAESTSAKTASAGKGASGKNPALSKSLQRLAERAALVGSDPLPRPEVVSKVWDYIKRKDPSEPECDN